MSGRDAFFYHALNAADHIAGAASISHDVAEQLANFAKIDIAAINKALPCAGVARDSGKRLIQFMGNGCRQFTHHCDTAEMAEFFAVPQRFRFSELASRNIHDRSQNKHALRRFNRI